ncbi:MAG: hypothetical protein EOS54_17330 [Mesorhizobium sp.]|uniref:hypothetical protein n=1 Tax=unclassified Mesorhizobium TaxID=325217 RepID=UPI000F76588E|nr:MULTISPECIES: hypothetical protein [unclassified Mesorhizobium]AZO51283.1 hypothetical protein EJ073_28830 [Mesorhizobium sp. M4B.F.Ca.ET.058.02.1.1]RVC41307.1 hypothetical protein EN781_26540 [Mesorhizobium sp. M4A.F.Ca.ET.090.04.2.1]RWC51934.1 MAG: hypothetical protein EOS54_17330 [Mesorhizobium sp.]RWD18243.1 MAG: hypothetical protein EOS74_04605 [Mesorhizobium sp.]RWD57924.1 MAG: hypothetical protein EOS75_10050 [Mesorhizobium sp.]
MSDAMILRAVAAVFLLALWLFYPLLSALLDVATSLWGITEMACDARSRATGAPVPLADDMEVFRIEAAPSEIGTTRIVPKPDQSSTTSLIGDVSRAKNDAARLPMRPRH